jgi:hypothetical protein
MQEELRLMRSEGPSIRRLTAPLAYRIGDDATASQVAVVFGALWHELDAALSPIVGRRGVGALGQRSLHLAATSHAWLVAGQSNGPAMLDVALLMPLLAQRSNDEAVAAASCFLQTFRELLASLIGLSLTERLLRPVWGPDSAPV